jgi:3-oxoacid CoA-transferase
MSYIVWLTRDTEDLCVFKVDREKGGLTLIELASGVTEDEVREKTGAPFKVAADVKQMVE